MAPGMCLRLFWVPNQFSNEPRGQHGDLFPMPLPVDHGFPGEVGGISSRRARQRVQKRRLLLSREAETVRALNNLAGFRLWSSKVVRQRLGSC